MEALNGFKGHVAITLQRKLLASNKMLIGIMYYSNGKK